MAGKFDRLTRFIEDFEEGDFCESPAGVIETDEGTLSLTDPAYRQSVIDFTKAMHEFAISHPEYAMTDYMATLEQRDLWGKSAEELPDPMTLDAETALAMLFAPTRAERFSPGALLGWLESGYMTALLERLRELDWMGGEAALDESTFNGVAQRMRLVSTQSCFKMPRSDDEVEQRLTVCRDGRVFLSTYDFGRGIGDHTLRGKTQANVPPDKAARVLDLIGSHFSVPHCQVRVTDVGSWDLTITGGDGNDFSAGGDLMGTKGLQWVSDQVRDALGMPDLYVFDDGPTGDVTEDDDMPGESFDGNFCFFWHEYEDNGYFSNWYASDFAFHGVTFSSGEQFMMYEKAFVFGDHDIMDRILDASTPSECKTLGKKAKGFDKELWDRVCRRIMRVGLREKFLQNPELLARLMGTGDRILAEASPWDPTWGIGLEACKEAAKDVTRWRGRNYLGRTLMEVRRDLRGHWARTGGEALPPMENYGRALDALGGMTLRELRLIPGVRGAVDAYVAVAARRSMGGPVTDDQYLSLACGTLDTLDCAYRTNTGGGLPAQGYYEMMFDLERMLELGLV